MGPSGRRAAGVPPPLWDNRCKKVARGARPLNVARTRSGEGPSVVDLIRRGRCNLVVNTPHGSGARTDGYLIREAALVARVPCITTLSGAAAAVHAIANARSEESMSLQERIEHETRAA